MDGPERLSILEQGKVERSVVIVEARRKWLERLSHEV